MLSITLYEIAFPTTDFTIEETNLDQIDTNDLKTLKKMQTEMDELMGSYDESVREFHKTRTIDQQFEKWKRMNALVFILRNNQNQIAGYAIVVRMITPNRCHVSELYLDRKYKKYQKAIQKHRI